MLAYVPGELCIMALNASFDFSNECVENNGQQAETLH